MKEGDFMLYEIQGLEENTIKGYKVRKFIHQDIKVKFVRKGISDKIIPYKTTKERDQKIMSLDDVMQDQLKKYVNEIETGNIDEKQLEYYKKCKYYLDNIQILKYFGILDAEKKYNINISDIRENDIDKYSLEQLKEIYKYYTENRKAYLYLTDNISLKEKEYQKTK